MKKTALIPALVVLLSGCTLTPSSSSAAPSSSPSVAPSSSTVSTSSSTGPEKLEAPTIDKVAAKLESYLEVGLSHYKYVNRSMNKNYVFGGYNENIYYTIETDQYTNGSDAIKTNYIATNDDLTFDNVYSSGPLKTYKLDDDYYVYGYVSNRNGMDQDDSFVEILERNRYNNETDMEYFSNGLGAVLDAFDGTSFWPESEGYELEAFSVEEEGDYYVCYVGATAPETDQYLEEDNHAWVKVNAYTYEIEEVGIYMQSLCHSSTAYAGELGRITQVILTDIVSSPLEEGEIEPFDLEKVPSYLVNDLRPKAVELPEGEISGGDALKVLKNMRSYAKDTNYAHHEFYQDVYGLNPETGKYEVQYSASCFEDIVTSDNGEIMSVFSYKDDDNNPETPHALQQTAINYCTDEGIVSQITSVVATDYAPQYTMSYTYDASNIYSLDDYLNPNGYYNGYYSMIFNEVSSLGWGIHDNGWSVFEYELVTATNVDGVIDIEFHINFEATENREAYTDVYVIQITDNFCNKIAKKTNGATEFDSWTNYKIEPMSY